METSPIGHNLLLVLFVCLSFCFVTVLAARTFLNKLFFNVIFFWGGWLNFPPRDGWGLGLLVGGGESLDVGPFEVMLKWQQGLS